MSDKSLHAYDAEVVIRQAIPDDMEFLWEMLYEAVFWDPDAPRSNFDAFRSEVTFQKLLNGWGRPGDQAFVAVVDTTNIGAAWYRLWTPEDHSYGFLDARTPELGLAVHRPYRSRGVGRLLLRRLMSEAAADGFTRISLSVDPGNRALKLYESEGFGRVGESGTSWTLAANL